MHLLVPTEGDEQIGEGLDGDGEFGDGPPERDKHRMVDPARVAGAQLPLPPVEQIEAARVFVDFIGQIVGPAAVGIDRVKMRPQSPRQEPAGDVKILVVRVGKAPTVSLALGERGRCAADRSGP